MTEELSTHRRRLSRRGFLAGSAGLLVTLAACGDDDSGPNGQAATASPTTSPVGYARDDMLIGTKELAGKIDDGEPGIVAFMPSKSYEAGHISGAAQVDWPAVEVTDTSDESLENWRADVEETLGELGLSGDDEIVIYDDGTLFAARLWWILHHLGHENKRVLNGGFAAWEQSGENVTDQSSAPEPAAYHGTANPDVLAQLDEVTAALGDDNVIFVDARSPEEYQAGHLPGAINVQYTRNAVAESPHVWKPLNELKRMYEDAGVTPDRHIIPYCSTGVRSAVTYFTLRLIGCQDVALFTGSWAEWSNHPDLPVET